MHRNTIDLIVAFVIILYCSIVKVAQSNSIKFEETKIDTCYFDEFNKTEVPKKPEHSDIKCALKCVRLQNCILYSYNSTESKCQLFEPKWKSIGCVNESGETVKAFKKPIFKDYDCGEMMLKLKQYTGKDMICEKDSSNITWILVQRRVNGKVKFDRPWLDYKTGFGDPNTGYWIGNEKLHRLTTTNNLKVRFDLWDKNNNYRFAQYSTFRVQEESTKYKLSISGYSGTAGDSMWYHKNQKFSTIDQDNDTYYKKCTEMHGNGGWWFKGCIRAHLNGRYMSAGTINSAGIKWQSFTNHATLKKSEIKITFK